MSLPRPIRSGDLRRAIATALALLVLLAGGAAAQDGRFDRGVLWRLDPPDGGKPSHLLGTMHVADPRVLDVPAPVLEALAASDTAVFELIEGQGAQQAVAASMFYDDGRTLDEVLGPELWQQTLAVARPYGLTSPLVRRYKPWGLMVIFSLPVEQMRMMMEQGTVLDSLLQERAAADGKALVGLETAAEQIAVFEAMDEDDQIALLAALVASKAENDLAFELMLRFYLERDLAGLAAIDEALENSLEAGVVARFMERLKTARDALMFERLQPLLADGGLFIAVGALHLTGESGLLERFAAAGYGVDAIY